MFAYDCLPCDHVLWGKALSVVKTDLTLDPLYS